MEPAHYLQRRKCRQRIFCRAVFDLPVENFIGQLTPVAEKYHSTRPNKSLKTTRITLVFFRFGFHKIRESLAGRLSSGRYLAFLFRYAQMSAPMNINANAIIFFQPGCVFPPFSKIPAAMAKKMRLVIQRPSPITPRWNQPRLRLGVGRESFWFSDVINSGWFSLARYTYSNWMRVTVFRGLHFICLQNMATN